MTLELKIEDNLLLAHLLASNPPDSEFKTDIINLQNKAWDISKVHYDLLIGRIRFVETHNEDTYHSLPAYTSKIKETDEFGLIKKQTQSYLEQCTKDWETVYPTCLKIIEELTGFDFSGSHFTGLITHPGLKNGRSFGNNIFMFGHRENWPHYAVVYFWHEILHNFFGQSNLEHAIIEFLTDEELRVRLNKSSYTPFVGHTHLATLKEGLLSEWINYVSNGTERDIKRFISFLQQNKKELIEACS